MVCSWLKIEFKHLAAARDGGIGTGEREILSGHLPPSFELRAQAKKRYLELE